MEIKQIPMMQKTTAILWPSFIVAGVATIFFTSYFDPEDVQACFGGPELSRVAYYSISFFLFWLFTTISSLGTSYYLLSELKDKQLSKET